MDILNHTDTQSPTFIRDVYNNLIGEDVVIYLEGGNHPLAGKLTAYNGAIIHLTSECGIPNTYIPSSKVIAIMSDK